MSSDSIPLGSSLRVTVTGETLPLIGGEKLLITHIKRKLDYLLERRGYSITENSSDFDVRFSYETKRTSRLSISSNAKSLQLNQYRLETVAGGATTSGLGVSIAKAIATVSNARLFTAEFGAQESVEFSHVLAVEIWKEGRLLVWKGESTWDTPSIEIRDDLTPTLQGLLSSLPHDQSLIPQVPRVRESHSANYFELECADRWFACPALPYRIAFQDPEPWSRASLESRVLPKAVIDPQAFPAYVDLLQTAEFVLPEGDDKWGKPLRIELWKRAKLGGRYRLGQKEETANILIELYGMPEGYVVSRCWIASDEEYGRFEKELAGWKQALQEYYDVFQ